MARKVNRKLVIGLDIGTSKVNALVGEIKGSEVEVIGLGTHPSTGLKRGVVVNIDATTNAIARAVSDAELMVGAPIRSVYAGIAGNHIRSLNSHGIVAIGEQEVTQDDVLRVVDAARAVAIPADQKILHILPQEFIVDHQGGIREPIGMSGVRLEAKVHMVTGAASAAQNIIKCVQRCGLEVSEIILEQLASSHSVLMQDEKELGVCLIDIGGGTMDIAIFSRGAIRYTSVIPVAGDQVTHDIAVALRISIQHAEKIKRQYACALPEFVNANDEPIELSNIDERLERSINRRMLTEIVHARYEELFQLLALEVQKSGLRGEIISGVVLTGGASNVLGCCELAEAAFKLPVRLGVPQYVKAPQEVMSNGMYATGVGLLLYGCQHQREKPKDIKIHTIVGKIKRWFRDNF
jgi:cell division protein FtsA